MEDTALLTQALDLVTDLNHHFQSDKRGTVDEERLQSNLTGLLTCLQEAGQLTNHHLLAMEKCYTACSLLIGIGAIHLGPETKQLWQAYECFCSEQVKPQLHLYAWAAGGL